MGSKETVIFVGWGTAGKYPSANRKSSGGLRPLSSGMGLFKITKSDIAENTPAGCFGGLVGKVLSEFIPPERKDGFSGGNSWLAIYPLSPGGGGAGDDFPWLVNFYSAGLWGFSSGN